MILGPQYSHHMNRVQPVDPDRQEGDQRDGKKKRVQYQGRAWAESEEDLALQPTIPQPVPQPATTRREPSGVYADRVLLDRAHRMFQKLTTVEEKAAQLCFLVTDAVYDAHMQREVELLIQTWQIGGILFHKGEYRRQAYLVERYQQVSKTPLLMANDFRHGLSFYLQGDELPKDPISEQHFSDLGKAVMAQNRRLGIHVQFDRARGSHSIEMSEEQAKAFRKGVRNAHGIVGKEKSVMQHESCAPTAKGGFPLLTTKDGSPFTEYQVQETISFKTLTFFDAAAIETEHLETELLGAFKQLYDVFLFSGNISAAISAIVNLCRATK